MNFDDALIDSTLWSCIHLSTNPDDFKTYLEHRPFNAAHIDEAEQRLRELPHGTPQAAPKFPDAVTQVQALAVAGDRTAQFHMGKFYDNGQGVPEDYQQAAHWYAMASAQGEIRAAHNLANLKLAGQGVAKDVDGAIALYGKAMDAGDPMGAEILGKYFLTGECRDLEKAVCYFRKAYALGSRSAGTHLGRLLYREATSTEQRNEAKALLTALVEHDYLPATGVLADIYWDGHQSDRDYDAARALLLSLVDSGQDEAMISLGRLDLRAPTPRIDDGCGDRLHWFKKAWETGVAEAAGYLGRAFLDGDGIEKSVDEALDWFQRGAEKGESACAYYVGMIHDQGLNGEANDRAAEPWYRHAAEGGLQAAQIALARLLVRDKGVRADGAEAVKWLTRAIQGGSTEAMLVLAHVYQNGAGVIRNERAAFELCHRAALAGDLVGQSETGWRLCQGIGCEKDIPNGLYWHRKAATSGRAYDQGLLAFFYLFGKFTLERDYDEAEKWARLSAMQGEDLGQYVLGECYFYGCGVHQDRKHACEWLKKAAEQGNVRAQAHLAEIFYRGDDGIARDLREAGRWASQAAEANHPVAQELLGRMFLFGEHVEADPKAAIEWFRLAAHQEEPEAMYWLGQLSADGLGTKRDWVAALKWLKKAADAGIAAAVTSLKSYGVEYTPGSQHEHRLSAEDDIAIDAKFDVQLLLGHWECTTGEMKMTYVIRPDGTFSGTAELGDERPITSEGRWAVRGSTLIWDIWDSSIPLDEPGPMDDQIVQVTPEELQLMASDGELLHFQRGSELAPPNHQILHFSKPPSPETD